MFLFSGSGEVGAAATSSARWPWRCVAAIAHDGGLIWRRVEPVKPRDGGARLVMVAAQPGRIRLPRARILPSLPLPLPLPRCLGAAVGVAVAPAPATSLHSSTPPGGSLLFYIDKDDLERPRTD